MIRNEYEFFSDPILFPLIIVYVIIIIPANLMIRYVL